MCTVLQNSQRVYPKMASPTNPQGTMNLFSTTVLSRTWRRREATIGPHTMIPKDHSPEESLTKGQKQPTNMGYHLETFCKDDMFSFLFDDDVLQLLV
jgi:hypothetical protein